MKSTDQRPGGFSGTGGGPGAGGGAAVGGSQPGMKKKCCLENLYTIITYFFDLFHVVFPSLGSLEPGWIHPSSRSRRRFFQCRDPPKRWDDLNECSKPSANCRFRRHDSIFHSVSFW